MFGVSSTYIHQRSGQILVIQKVQKYHQHIFYNPSIPSILSHHAENWLNECSIELTASFYRRCVGDIFVLFESPESSHSFREYICSEHQHINLTVEHENILSFSFLDVKIFVRTVNLSLVFTENQHLDEHSPVMKVSFQRTNRGDFYTHNFKGVSAYVVISRHFIWKSII